MEYELRLNWNGLTAAWTVKWVGNTDGMRSAGKIYNTVSYYQDPKVVAMHAMTASGPRVGMHKRTNVAVAPAIAPSKSTLVERTKDFPEQPKAMWKAEALRLT